MSRDEILAHVQNAMGELFELAPDGIHPGARLIEDFDLDSIDAIDMAARLQRLTGKRVPEQALKSLRTVGDVVELVASQLATETENVAEAERSP